MKLPRPLLFAIKAVLLAILIKIYEFKHHLHPNLLLFLYCCHMYLSTEIILAITAGDTSSCRARLRAGAFNEPYLAASLQEFWGRRWNLLATNILRPTIYNPVKSIFTRILGRKWAPIPGVLAAFLVSGLMHELIWYYLTRVSPRWEVTGFFVLQGLSTVSEVVVKKAVGGRWRLHRAVSGALTIGFVGVTAVWLFFPQLLPNGIDEKAIKEYSILVDLAKQRLSPLFTGHHS